MRTMFYSNMILMAWKVRMHKEDKTFKKGRYISDDFFPVTRHAAASTQDKNPSNSCNNRHSLSQTTCWSQMCWKQHLGDKAVCGVKAVFLS